MKRSLLVMSIERNASRAIINAARSSQHKYRVIGITSDFFHSSNFACDAVHYLDKDEINHDSIFSILNSERPDIVLTGSDDDLLFLSLHRSEIDSLGTACPVGTKEAISACCDKWRSFNLMTAAGVPFIQTYLPEEIFARLGGDVEFPLIVKPRAGNSSAAVQLIKDENELKARIHNDKYVVIQPFVRDFKCISSNMLNDYGFLRQENEYSVQVIIGFSGNTLGVFQSKNNLHNGVPVTVEVTNSMGLRESVNSAVSVLISQGIIGPCNLQCFQTAPNKFEFFEFNARCTGITGVRALYGFNEVDALYDHFVLHKSFIMKEPDENLVAHRHWTESLIDKRSIQALKEEKHWSAT